MFSTPCTCLQVSMSYDIHISLSVYFSSTSLRKDDFCIRRCNELPYEVYNSGFPYFTPHRASPPLNNISSTTRIAHAQGRSGTDWQHLLDITLLLFRWTEYCAEHGRKSLWGYEIIRSYWNEVFERIKLPRSIRGLKNEISYRLK